MACPSYVSATLPSPLDTMLPAAVQRLHLAWAVGSCRPGLLKRPLWPPHGQSWPPVEIQTMTYDMAILTVIQGRCVWNLRLPDHSCCVHNGNLCSYVAGHFTSTPRDRAMQGRPMRGLLQLKILNNVQRSYSRLWMGLDACLFCKGKVSRSGDDLPRV